MCCVMMSVFVMHTVFLLRKMDNAKCNACGTKKYMDHCYYWPSLQNETLSPSNSSKPAKRKTILIGQVFEPLA